jgi:hypothetical protein
MNFKKITLIAFALAFLLTSATLYAQTSIPSSPPHFIYSTTPFVVRVHGQTETIGDMVLTCDVPGHFPLLSGIRVDFDKNTAIVNASATGTFTVASNIGPPAAHTAYAESEYPGYAVPGRTDPIGATGIAISGMQRVVTAIPTNWILIQITDGSWADVGDMIRISGVRMDIAQANSPVAYPPGNLEYSINAIVNAVPPGSFTIDNVNTLEVAQARNEIVVSDASGTLIQCLPGTTTGTVTVTELIPNAFTTLTQEDNPAFTPYVPNTGELPSFGTWLYITIGNVAPGVTVTAPAATVSTTSLSELDCFTGTSPNGTTACTYTNSGSTAASYKFAFYTKVSILNVLDTFNFVFTFTSTIPTSLYPIPQATATVQLAPVQLFTPTTFWLGTAGVGVGSAHMISFYSPIINPSPNIVLAINPCRTYLLCKFVSTAVASTSFVAGGDYDTGIAIANTSKDIFGTGNYVGSPVHATPQQTGACHFFPFGAAYTPSPAFTVPANYNSQVLPSFDTPSIPTGTVYPIRVSDIMGYGFTGYAILACDFQYAHAEAIIADKNFSVFSHGYDCLIVPDPTINRGYREASGPGFIFPNAGEGLTQKTSR